jgi:hypothetical protein
MASPLAAEKATFERHRKELLGTAEGKFVLITDGEILGTFETEADAIAEGYRHLGNVPFLVKRVQAVDTAANFTSHLIGHIGA